MQLKDFQNDVLESLSGYLQTLAARRERAEKFAKLLAEQGETPEPANWCREAWEKLAADNRIPRFKDGDTLVTPAYIDRKDGLHRPVPNICLKVPTGGGKTLLGCAALGRIGTEFFRKQTGFVLWIVPSDAIYQQTWKAFANRESPYRQMLERASGGRVKLLEKSDTFTPPDVENHLCVMLMMLQAGAVRKETKEARKMFQDSGKFPGFFPEVDDTPANKELLRHVANLETADIGEDEFRIGGLTVKQSLANVLRLVRPLVVIDEGHKAYSNTALEFIAEHNPRFILELSATPNAKEQISNVLVNVTGTALKDEQMIKLPINLVNIGRADWKHTLAEAKEKLDDLQREAGHVRGNEGRYIRPMLVVRVERTGKDQRDKSAVHAEDAREYLVEKLGAQPDEIKVKSAELDELSAENLFSETCQVRYVITKDALREGWDCSFAYVLVVLSKTTATTALTQMIGRVLRQPDARLTSRPALNESYVFTFDQEVQQAVESVRRGLQEEGMGDLAHSVRAAGKGGATVTRTENFRRREKFKDLKIFLPRVLSKHPKTGEWRVFDYERDMLSHLDWSQFNYTGKGFSPDTKESLDKTIARVSVENLNNVDDTPRTRVEMEAVEPIMDIPALVRMLLDVIPNPWQGVRILDEALAHFRQARVSEERLFTNRLFLLKAMKDDLRRQVNEAGEAEFRRMLEKGELAFRLETSGDENLNWQLAETLEIEVADEDKEQLREDGTRLERSLFEKVYRRQLNGLERDVAWYLDGATAVRWWHRIAVHQDWHLQGWQRARVYPDFLACLEERSDGKLRFTVLETKGLHLKGNDDTAYKDRLFELLTCHSQTALTVGELKLGLKTQQMRFELMLENNWRERIKQGVE